jgi:hypothetical protein
VPMRVPEVAARPVVGVVELHRLAFEHRLLAAHTRLPGGLVDGGSPERLMRRPITIFFPAGGASSGWTTPALPEPLPAGLACQVWQDPPHPRGEKDKPCDEVRKDTGEKKDPGSAFVLLKTTTSHVILGRAVRWPGSL